MGRGHQKDLGSGLIGSASGDLNGIQNAAHAACDIEAVELETLLGVVGTQHDDHQIHRLLTVQTGDQIRETAAISVDRIIPDHCAAVEPLLDDDVLLA